MTGQKPKDALDTLGTILTQDEGKDAVHVAVVCCRSEGTLIPSQEVVLLVAPDDTDDGIPVVGERNLRQPVIGIVDPFLGADYRHITTGKLFWVFLTPRTITSLKHVWTHPAFPEEK